MFTILMSSKSYNGLEYFEIELDSLDNSGAFTSEYSALNWPQFRLGLPLQNIVAIKILEAQIPFSYYVINSANNTFTLTESVGNVDTTVTIPIGNYNSTSLCEVLALTLSDASANDYTYTVEYNPSTYKLKITSSGGNTFTLTFGAKTNSGNVNPRLYIGFPGGATASDSSGVLVTPNTILISGQSYLYINSRTIGSDCSLYLPVNAFNITNGGQGPQMCKVPINCLPGSTIYWQDPDP